MHSKHPEEQERTKTAQTKYLTSMKLLLYSARVDTLRLCRP